MRSCIVIIFILLSGCAANPHIEYWESSAGLEALAWLTGSWINERGSSVSEEHWTSPQAGSMIGMNRTIVGDRTVFYEYLRIERTHDGIVYFASPKGRFPPTEFRLTDQSHQFAVFENLMHDFPQRIVYELEGDTLLGRIEGMKNDQPHSEHWSWQRK